MGESTVKGARDCLVTAGVKQEICVCDLAMAYHKSIRNCFLSYRRQIGRVIEKYVVRMLGKTA